MSIHFCIDDLPFLYHFKRETIQLCVSYVKDVVKSSHKRGVSQLQSKLKEIEIDLYDLFCRWNFTSLLKGRFDVTRCLPLQNTTFIMQSDLDYYLNRFQLSGSDSIIEFPHAEFQALLTAAYERTKKVPPPRLMYPSDVQNKRLTAIYSGEEYKDDSLKLLARYQYFGGLNNSLSVPNAVLNIFPKSHELFGTPLNTYTSFCSPFQDESVFSSHGSFFHFSEFKEDTVYFANPPFDDVFCDHVADRLLDQLSRGLFALIVIIPVWDNEEQKKLGLKDFHLPFPCYRKLVSSPYLLSETFLEKESYPFYNYFTQRYVYISNTHIINLGVKVDTEKIIEEWKKLNRPKSI
jgi:hypothetical protein